VSAPVLDIALTVEGLDHLKGLSAKYEKVGIIPYAVRWNGMQWSSRDAVTHLLAIWPVAIFGGYVARYFHSRSGESDPTG
jgi:hypothetical protein